MVTYAACGSDQGKTGNRKGENIENVACKGIDNRNRSVDG